MLSVLLTIIKILGVILLILLGIILMLILAVLFVPVRYGIKAHRRVSEGVPVVAEIKVTWFLHILNLAFSYPQAAFLRVRVFCFTVFRSDRRKEQPDTSQKEKRQKKKKQVKEPEKQAEKPAGKEDVKKEATDKISLQKNQSDVSSKKEQMESSQNMQEENSGKDNSSKDNSDKDYRDKGQNKAAEFLSKLWMSLKNIKYTITGICDKIKHIVKNIQYYINIIKSDTFARVWEVCSAQVLSLLKSIRPRKMKGELLIGTGDPASTGQILAAYGILYPLLGNHIDIVPDFEHQIIEGELVIKGKITVCRALKTAWIIYFNKDLRRLIKLFKREAV